MGAPKAPRPREAPFSYVQVSSGPENQPARVTEN